MAGASARGRAAALVLGVTEERRTLADQIAGGALDPLAPAERARAQRLALTALRNLSRADALLKPHMRKPPPPAVRAVLRTAVAEVFAEGAPAHGVVSETVGALRAGGKATQGFAAMANAVLRRACETPAERWAGLPPEVLPGWLRGRLMSAWGKRATIAMEAAQARGAAHDLTPRDGDGAGLAARLGAQLLPTGSVRLAGSGPISELPGYAEGAWWVQDAAAALAAPILAPKRGERVLDLCAAPGGKTMQLAAAGAEVTALDLSDQRMTRLRENLARTGLSATTVVADALDWQPPARFDAILLDAPCSATGTIRRHPDLPHVRDASGLKDLAALQAQLLDRALGWLRPGGRLVYATCSLLPEEGEAQIAAARERHAGLAPIPGALARPGVEPGWITPAGDGLRLRPDYWPDAGGMDGFFIACLATPASPGH
ncbi:MAG: methyltransferase domain-containing protein [Defluviimonas sp.]|uniref:RsmB/NOP family class I SAM-dependent RNA methyltransferase n=1 Tax=Albidovulum sp. TaxID=1872424 RepID=UPI002A304666|nr:methyltransferase domain-containing protein [Defluviimonas sp.]